MSAGTQAEAWRGEGKARLGQAYNVSRLLKNEFAG